jgi:hypothetical protein
MSRASKSESESHLTLHLNVTHLVPLGDEVIVKGIVPMATAAFLWGVDQCTGLGVSRTVHFTRGRTEASRSDWCNVSRGDTYCQYCS